MNWNYTVIIPEMAKSLVALEECCEFNVNRPSLPPSLPQYRPLRVYAAQVHEEGVARDHPQPRPEERRHLRHISRHSSCHGALSGGFSPLVR